MNIKNQHLQNSLRCLQHPATILSILLLLLNDNILKFAIPSWLTGKLSDFAGLFFFPFIVAALLSLLFIKAQNSPRQFGQIAFGLTVLWFALVKTSLFINLLTSKMVSLFVRRNAQIILDPTDLIALVVIFPAWKLWNQTTNVKSFNRLAYIILAIGTYAMIATSPREWTVSSVTDLVYSDDGVIYAADRKNFGHESYPIAKSLDGGLTWERDYSQESLPVFSQRQYPIQVCNSPSKKLNRNCYRVTIGHQIERFSNDSWIKVFPSDVVVKGYDMILFTREEQNYLLIAIGEAGVLRRELPDGNWEIIPVINAGSW